MNTISAALSQAAKPKIAFAEQGTCHCLSCASQSFLSLAQKAWPPATDLPSRALIQHTLLCWRMEVPKLHGTTATTVIATMRMPAPNLQEQRAFVVSIQCFYGAPHVWYLVEESATLGLSETPLGPRCLAPPLLWFPLYLIPCGCSSLGW